MSCPVRYRSIEMFLVAAHDLLIVSRLEVHDSYSPTQFPIVPESALKSQGGCLCCLGHNDLP